MKTIQVDTDVEGKLEALQDNREGVHKGPVVRNHFGM